MTNKEQQELGIFKIKSRHNNVYFIPIAGDMILPEDFTIEHVYEAIYEAGKRDGIELEETTNW